MMDLRLEAAVGCKIIEKKKNRKQQNKKKNRRKKNKNRKQKQKQQKKNIKKDCFNQQKLLLDWKWTAAAYTTQ